MRLPKLQYRDVLLDTRNQLGLQSIDRILMNAISAPEKIVEGYLPSAVRFRDVSKQDLTQFSLECR